MMADSDAIERAVSRWRGCGVRLLPPAPEADVARAFEELGSPLSVDVRRMYSAAGGFADGDMDGLWSLLPLVDVREELGAEHQVLRPRFVWFADWLYHSHVYCFRYESPEVSSVHIDHNAADIEPYQVTPSLADFLEALMQDPDSVEAWDLGA